VPLPLRWQWKLDRWRASLAGIFRPAQKPARPRLCPACGTLVGSTATRCHECGASLTYSLAAASRSLSGLLPTESPITYCALGLNFLLFIVSLLGTMQSSQGGQLSLFGGISGQVLGKLGATNAYAIVVEGQVWRLVTAIFLHGGLLHIGFNTLVLMDLGPQLEELYGSARYLFLYVVTGIAGYVLSLGWALATGGPGISVGASGALMGLIGAMIAVTSRRGGAYMQMVRSQLVKWVIYIFVLGLLMRGIDNAAHLGGLAAGFLIGRVMNDREPATASERTRAYALGWAAGLVVIASFAAMMLGYFRAG
jgi:rhomboid protease GluP